ncbi:MAG: ABC transporter ATP-binding protein [Deltaproteobacteria bacterium]|nr:ABC transporter ATP-binding protein [Deltaproteobacteria bacterium]
MVQPAKTNSKILTDAFPQNNDTVLNVKDLSVRFYTRRGIIEALRGISFSMKKEQVLGIVGESGSGKSVLALSILNLVEKPGNILSGEIIFDGVDLLKLSKKKINKIRGRRISMIFSDPMSAFDPTLPVGNQILETIRRHHKGISRKEAREMAIDLFHKVKIPSPIRRLEEYPSMFSGGMIQRAMIADALSSNPELIVADNPTQALDVTIQQQILELLSELKHKQGTTLILITNSLPILARYADEIMVLYAGGILEHGEKNAVFLKPSHPYTRGLIDSTPKVSGKRFRRLKTIRGFTPSRVLTDLKSPKCVFLDRCDIATATCHERQPDPVFIRDTGLHYSKCFLASQMNQMQL